MKLGLERFFAARLHGKSVGSFSKFASMISLCAIALSVCFMLVSSSFIKGFQYEIQHKIFYFWGQIHVKPFSLSNSYNEQSILFDSSFYNAAKTQQNVENIYPVCLKGGILKNENGFEGVLLKGLPKNYNQKYISNFLVDGNLAKVFSSEDRHIALSKKIADRLHIKVGDKIFFYFMGKNIRIKNFTVSAIFNTGIDEIDKQFALTNIENVQNINSWEANEISSFEIFLKDISLLNDTHAALSNFITNPEINIVTIQEIIPSVFDWLELQKMNEYIIIGIMLLVAIVNMTTLILIYIIEQTNTIGILKILGGNNSFIQRIFVLVGSNIILKGIFIGNIVALFILLIQYQFKLITLPEESYYVHEVPVYFSLVTFLGINIMTLVVCSLSLFIPTKIISKISLIKAIQFK